MNPARSLTWTAVLPRSPASRASAPVVPGEVSTVEMTSTSFITGAGLKKCSPATPARIPGAVSAISVTDSEEVLVARIASARQAASSSAYRARFRSIRSGMASITRSAFCHPGRDAVRRPDPGHYLLPRGTGQLAPGNRPVQRHVHPGHALIQETLTDLDRDHPAAAPGDQLHDARTHQAKPDHRHLTDTSPDHAISHVVEPLVTR